MVEIGITGAAGRMGGRLAVLACADENLRLVCAIERAGHESIGRDVGEVAGIGAIGVPIAAEPKAMPAVLIDFSTPAATRVWLEKCAQAGTRMVVGTTGLSAEDHALIDVAARRVAVLQAPNMSLGVNLLFTIAAQVARRLGDDYDIEIVEAHHRFKKDAPSGTAWGLVDAILAARGIGREAVAIDRQGEDCVRRRGQVGVHALRMGDEVGRHTAYFAALGERLELTHTATSRDTFASGALRAAAWLSHKPPGRYSMADVLGL